MKWLKLHLVQSMLALVTIIMLLFVADKLCYQFALPVAINEQDGNTTLSVGNTKLALGKVGWPMALQLETQDNVIHEYQMDGTDSTNNFTLDQSYFDQIVGTPYYQFQAWMRNLDGTSQWQNLEIYTKSQHLISMKDPTGATVSLPTSPNWHLTMQLQRPETPRIITILMMDASTVHIIFNRNDRYIKVIQSVSGQQDVPLANAFFPTESPPFAAMVLDLLIRTALWSCCLLLMVLLGETALALIVTRLKPTANRETAQLTELYFEQDASTIDKTRCEDFESGQPAKTEQLKQAAQVNKTLPRTTLRRSITMHPVDLWQKLTNSVHPIGLVALCFSLGFVAWIAKVQYNGEPHIFDANAYLFAAKMYASGHLSAPIPPAINNFPGPFMLLLNGRWFTQYPPGTGLTLVPGIWLGVPWLVEPVLGTLGLLGIGLVTAQLYDRRVATLAVLLGTFSPFYSYLAASYLSHAVALFYLIWGCWAFLRFAQRKASWHLPLAACFFGMGALTRDLVAIMFAGLVCSVVLLLYRQNIRSDWRRWRVPGAFFVLICLFFLAISLGFNAILTHNPLITPRNLFFAGDHWGFGQNVGFYGQHTLAAGFVNLDAIVTLLAIDLYGWPFYLTLAFLMLPFLTWRATLTDWLLLGCATVMTASFIGYFYHGIYLGPRYMFETLPFLLILTARGILILASIGRDMALMVQRHHLITRRAKSAISPVAGYVLTIILLIGLVGCNLLYFMPRQIEIHRNYSGLPTSYTIDLTTLYQPPMHNSIIITENFTIYQFVLFPLNDPLLHNDVIYALGSSTVDYTNLRRAFPGRELYHINIDPNGTISYTRL